MTIENTTLPESRERMPLQRTAAAERSMSSSVRLEALFCARSAVAARVLLEAMRERTASPAVLLVVENDLELEQQLRAAGAVVALEAWHYCKQLRAAASP